MWYKPDSKTAARRVGQVLFSKRFCRPGPCGYQTDDPPPSDNKDRLMDEHTPPAQPQRRGTLSSLLLAVGAVTPFVAALLLTPKIPQGVALGPAPERPSLAFAQYAVDLGEVPPRPMIQAHYDFWNKSDQPVKITKLDPSCGCLRPRLTDDRDTIAPGEHGQFVVGVSTANEDPGPHDYSITVHYNDGEPRTQDVRFLFTLPERKVSLEPSEVFFYQLTGEPDSRTVLVNDHRGSGMKVLAASISSKHATATVEAPQVLGKKGSRTPVRIDVAGNVPAQREIAMLVIETDDPEYKVLRVPVLIQGPEPDTTLSSQPAETDEPANE